MKFLVAAFVIITFILILEVHSESLLSDILQLSKNNGKHSMDEEEQLQRSDDETRMKGLEAYRRSISDSDETWGGRWFPDKVTPPPRRKINPTNVEQENKFSDENWTGRWLPEKITERPQMQHDKNSTNNMWQMINATCDDGHTNLTVDWDLSPINYTCFDPAHVLLPDPNTRGMISRDYVPAAYSARHICMKSTIEYDTFLPTFGPHRPAWPKYGEYQFVPRQRWLHNLEHGAVVMLYHPCAHPVLVNRLRRVVTSCLYRHVITPYTLLPPNRPLALVTWGWAYLMPDVDTESAIKFIREHALNGPERTHNDGQYDQFLLKHAEIVSNIEDETICPI
uniref:DUF3105 domain-containing protein n=1 Tax=Clastoptera arizonana TaxID=38151 RepID=A0A1B6EFA4_9HEMI